MNFEPGKFYIGIIDFFSVLLPGALLVYLIKDEAYDAFFDRSLTELHPTEQWILVAFASYLLGHFIFLLGSFLDDLVYDKLRRATFGRQLSLLAKGEEISPRWVRALAPKFFKPQMDNALKKAIELKRLLLNPLDADDTHNVFKWCKTRLELSSPPALAQVERYEANSKFFRSLLVVLVLILPVSLICRNWLAALAILLMIVGSLWRYIDQRKKGVQQAYWSVIVQEAEKPLTIEKYASQQKHIFTHGGGLVYKVEGKERRYLLVRAKADQEVWVLPKGHIERGESVAETAVREIFEETGVWARVKAPLGPVAFEYGGEEISVQFYLLEFQRQEKSQEKRATQWVTLEACLKLISFKDTRKLLQENKKLLERC